MKKTKKPTKKFNPGDMFNAFQKKKNNKLKKGKKGSKKKGGLRPADVVVKSEQNASHQFYKKGSKKKRDKKNDKDADDK